MNKPKDIFTKLFKQASCSITGQGLTVFVAQPKGSTFCGQVALFNVLRWLNKEVDWQHITAYTRHHKIFGTPIAGINDYLLKRRISFSYRRHLKIRDIERNLAEGHAVMYLYTPANYGAHYSFIIADKGKSLLVANHLDEDGYHHPLAEVSKDYYNNLAKTFALNNWRRGRVYPQGWVIRRRKKAVKQTND